VSAWSVLKENKQTGLIFTRSLDGSWTKPQDLSSNGHLFTNEGSPLAKKLVKIALGLKLEGAEAKASRSDDHDTKQPQGSPPKTWVPKAIWDSSE